MRKASMGTIGTEPRFQFSTHKNTLSTPGVGEYNIDGFFNIAKSRGSVFSQANRQTPSPARVKSRETSPQHSPDHKKMTGPGTSLMNIMNQTTREDRSKIYSVETVD